MGQLIAIRFSRILVGMFICLLVYGAISGFSIPATEAPGEPPSLVLRFASAVMAMIFLSVFATIGQVIVTAIMAYAREQKGVIGKHTLVLTDDGLIERTDYNETLHRWKGLFRVRESGHYIFLYVTEAQYHLMPKCSFASVDEMRSFLDEIQGRARSAT